MENETVLERAEPLAALCVEFVAKPEEVHRLRSAIPAEVRDGLGQVPGFAGCVVLISDREARLISVITFWKGTERKTKRSKRALWLHDLLTPYVDHWLRVQTLDAYVGAGESAHQVKNCSEQKLPLCAA